MGNTKRDLRKHFHSTSHEHGVLEPF